MIETRQYGCLAQELVAGFLSNVFREGTVVFNFLQRTLAALETGVVCKVNGPHATLANAFSDFIAAAQYLPALEGWEQSSPFWAFWGTSVQNYFGVVLHRNAYMFMLYNYNILR
jgi:hypothetical protein